MRDLFQDTETDAGWLCSLHNLFSVHISVHWGPYIKYVGGGGDRRVFVGVMKYFRHILTGREIFFKIFDGPQNIYYVLFS